MAGRVRWTGAVLVAAGCGRILGLGGGQARVAPGNDGNLLVLEYTR
jgi:hypothetical protein